MDMDLGGNEHDQLALTALSELTHFMIEQLLGTKVWNSVLHALSHLIFTYLDDYYLHFTGANTKAQGGHITKSTLYSQRGDFKPRSVHLQRLCSVLLDPCKG
jgi:hypothetical protein